MRAVIFLIIFGCCQAQSTFVCPQHSASPPVVIARTDKEPTVLTLNMYISEKYLSGKRLTEIVCSLKNRATGDKPVRLFLFDDLNAAKNFWPDAWEQENRSELLWHLRAIYRKDKQGVERIEYALPSLDGDQLYFRKFSVQLTRQEK